MILLSFVLVGFVALTFLLQGLNPAVDVGVLFIFIETVCKLVPSVCSYFQLVWPKNWSVVQLHHHLENEMAVHGIVNLTIDELANFDAFRSGSELCKIRFHDGGSRPYVAWVFPDLSVVHVLDP